MTLFKNFPTYSVGTNTSFIYSFLEEHNIIPTYFTHKNNPNFDNDNLTIFNFYDKNKKLIISTYFNPITAQFIIKK